jgi:hypothetical protein
VTSWPVPLPSVSITFQAQTGAALPSGLVLGDTRGKSVAPGEGGNDGDVAAREHSRRKSVVGPAKQALRAMP